jgi:DNA polymerase III epsilon subunit-like protein
MAGDTDNGEPGLPPGLLYCITKTGENMSEKHVMIDLETLGTDQDAVVLSIGAVLFEPGSGSVIDKFHYGVDVSTVYGRSISSSTVVWWLRQTDAARESLIETLADGAAWCDALDYLADFVPKDAHVWGNGSTFDVAILNHAYDQLGKRSPWSFRNVRDYRTIMHIAKAAGFTPSRFDGIAHNALADAEHQTKQVIDVWAFLKLS